MQTGVMACMRDECMFALEWAAYHRVIGFDRVIIATNACSDGTDALCDRLARLGVITHVENPDDGRTAPQVAGVARVLAQPGVERLRWLLHIDSDEFLNILDGDGRLGAWLPRLGEHDAAAITWRLFGDGGLEDWPEGGLQIEHFSEAAAKAMHFTAMQKTMFRPAAFAAGIDHMPKAPRHADVTLCNAVGRTLHPGALFHPSECDHRAAGDGTVNRKRHLPWLGAVINHYAVRTRDLFLMKNLRGDGKLSRFSRRYQLHSRWHRAANRNDVRETSIQRMLPETRMLMSMWRAQDPEIGRIEAAARARFDAARRDWLTPETVMALTNSRFRNGGDADVGDTRAARRLSASA
jgi:hypothetical protein